MRLNRRHFFYAVPFLLLGAFFIYDFFSPSPLSKPRLNVLTYSSFAGVYGPGRKLKKEFEKTCQCEVHWLMAEDSTGLLQRLKLGVPVDAVVGLDQISLFSARRFPWKNSGVETDRLLPEIRPFQDAFFVPVDWAPIGWIYRDTGLKSVQNFFSLFSLPKRISFPEPENSTLGLQFYYWLYESAGGDTDLLEKALKGLKTKKYGSIPSWSLAYGFFRKGHVEMSLAYLTSLIYHRSEEADFSFQFAYFEKGHPWQVEFAGISGNCRSCDSALRFVDFLLTPPAQKIIMESHFMFPVIPGVKSGLFSELRIPKKISYRLLPDFLKNRNRLLKVWRDHL